MKTKLLFILFLLVTYSYSQELPPISKYDSNTYGAGNQNWMISQDKNNFIFFANNEGLLEFNGSSWTLYPSPNETIIRSVKVIDNKIYTGCYMEFGYWKRKGDGQLQYTSLSKTLKNKLLDDEQFWNILNYDQWVIFQSLDRIYIYDTKTNQFKVVGSKSKITKSYSTANAIYFQTVNDGLFEIESGASSLVSDNAVLKSNRIINIFNIEEGLLIQTEFNGFYKLTGKVLTKFSTQADTALSTSRVYSSQMLIDGSLAIGTVSDGVFMITKNGEIKYHITQAKGLSNNTALSLHEDSDKNLWIGLDNGINCINMQSPVKSFVDESGNFGTVYASKLFKNILYIGTNQGLFCKPYLSNDKFKFISGTKGQVWSLFEYDETLFCGHDSGTFIIESGFAKNISPMIGTWKFEPVPGQKSLVLQGTYDGVSVLSKINNQWVFRNKIVGFNYSSKYFEITKTLEVYVSHEYKGVFRFQLDNKLLKTTAPFTTFSKPTKGKNASLVKFNDVIYYAYKEGVFKLNNQTKEFEKDNILSAVIEKEEYTSGKLIKDNTNKVWLFSKNYIHYFSKSKLSNQLKHDVIPIPAYLSNTMLGYENISQINNTNYLIGTNNGYFILNISDLNIKNYLVTITAITTNKINEIAVNRIIQKEGDFKSNENNITFNYTVPEYNKYINAEYQYALIGFQEEWSEWSSKSTVNFKNLYPGNYVFKVKSKFANSNLDNIATYSFTILKPFYKTNLAIFLYILVLLVMVHFVNKAYQNYYQKQREKLIEENNMLLEIKELELEQQFMKLENEQLAQDVDDKNRELAVSNMSLNSKNELLAFIKDDLKNTSATDNPKIKSVIRTINKNITEDDSWNVFKAAFDNADKDFLKKVKQQHPLLTPNDLRLCAYLRLNLSSKEVAPLLNISVRSVEIKRYRLRKKMDLPHEQGLVEYILSV